MTDPRIQTIREGLRYLQRYSTFNTTPALAALDSLAADLEAARETLLVISGWDASAAKRHAAMGMREYAAAALARLSAGKETGDE